MKSSEEHHLRSPKPITEISLYKSIRDLATQLATWMPNMRGDSKVVANQYLINCADSLASFRSAYRHKQSEDKIKYCYTCFENLTRVEMYINVLHKMKSITLNQFVVLTENLAKIQIDLEKFQTSIESRNNGESDSL